MIAFSSATNPRTGNGLVLALLLLLFAASGAAALIYEIVWFQLLQLVIGDSGGVSLGVLLAAYMGGMCLGSAALPRVVSARRHPFRVYAGIEVSIAVFALLVQFAMPLVASIYSTPMGYGLSGTLLRAAICSMGLLAPTILIGASLPAVARWLETSPGGIYKLGLLYGGNIGGAVLGCLVVCIYLLRHLDLTYVTYFAVTINLAVAALSLLLAQRTPYDAGIALATAGGDRQRPWLIYSVTALSGLCALGGEVIWTRNLSLMLGATVYTFSILLAVFLAGSGLGSWVGAALKCDPERARVALGWCQFLLVAAIAWTAFAVDRSVPHWPINSTLSLSPWFTFQIDLVRTIYAILPPALLWGASFSLALAAVPSPDKDPGRLVGGIHAANSLGAIVGALGFSLLAIPAIGTEQSQRLLIWIAAVATVLALNPWAPKSQRTEFLVQR